MKVPHLRTFRRLGPIICNNSGQWNKSVLFTWMKQRDSHINLARTYTSDTSEQEPLEQAPAGDDGSDSPLYDGHIPTTFLQKSLLSFGAAAVALAKPWRGDMVATFGETSGYYALKYIQQKMLNDPVGRQILAEKPRINTKTVDLKYLHSLPQGTLGNKYATWLDINRASPDERLPVNFVDDTELAYVMTRYREVHDLLHTVLGMPTNMLGEVAVKWVEALQTGLPMCALAALGGPVRFGPKARQMYLNNHLWWAIRNGRNANFFLNVYYEHHWDMQVTQLRSEMNFEEPPDTPEKSWKKS